METNGNPLVSVRILTYNASKYIIETLDSVYHQTYDNIELVISDDCSKDNTVDLCNRWLEQHGTRFAKVVFLTTSVNTGVCANSKRSLEATTGDWIKGLGGDDCFYPQAIEEYVRFVQEQKCEICAAKMSYMDDEGKDLVLELGGTYDAYMLRLQSSYKKQFRLAKQKIIVPGPVLFYSRKVFEATGGPDANYGTADEWSFLYKTLKNGFRVYPLDKVLIKYRVRSGSLTRSNNGKLSQASIDSNRRFMKEVLLKEISPLKEPLLWWHLYVKYRRWGSSKAKILSLVDPLWYIEKIKPI
jgi:alpha-1,3-rhamnosyltransferase